MPRPRRKRSMTRPNAVGLGECCSSAGTSGYSALITWPICTSPRPIAVSTCSAAPSPSFCAACSSWSGVGESSRRRRTSRARISRPSVTVRREHEDLVLIEVDLQELEKLLRTVRILLQLDELAEPRQMVIELVGTLAVLLVQPVRGDAVLRRAVHVAGADLDLVQLSGRPEHRGVQGLIAVRLGARGVVLDPLLQRRPCVVDDAQHVVAVGDAVDEHADREQVVDLVERLAALLHLLEDGP